MVKIDRILRSRRKSIGLTINNQAELIVRAPHWLSVSEIERIVGQKEEWILKKKNFFAKRKQLLKKQFIENEQFLYLGKTYSLRITDAIDKAVVLSDEYLQIHRASQSNAHDHLTNWYKEQALEHIRHRVKFYAASCGLKYTTVRVNEAKTRWGSCSYTDTLNFTWRLIMAPERVIDYVVVHELMHLKQMNHS